MLNAENTQPWSEVQMAQLVAVCRKCFLSPAEMGPIPVCSQETLLSYCKLFAYYFVLSAPCMLLQTISVNSMQERGGPEQSQFSDGSSSTLL